MTSADAWISLDVPAMAPDEAYKVAIGSVLPRPIAFVSSVDAEGVVNLAPFSFFTVASANPLTLAFCPLRRGAAGTKKDTLVNIEATGEFVVNIVDEAFADAMNLCSAAFAPGVSEFAASGLTPTPCEVVKAPRVGQSPVAFECVLDRIVEVGSGPMSGAIVLGRVVRAHVRADLFESGRIRLDGWHPIGRLAGASYTRVADLFEMPRPVLAEATLQGQA